MPNAEFTDRRLVDRGVEACQDNTAVRMGFIETRLTEHTKILEQNAALSVCLNERFDNFETALNVERRAKDAVLAGALDEWQKFSILKFDESSERQKVIEENQALHMKSTAAVQESIGTLLEIVSTLNIVKKTAGRFGRCGLWLGTRAGKLILWAGGLAAAWLAITGALKTSAKAVWPWL